MNLTAYEGKSPYIFVSYAHKDSQTVLPIISALQSAGFRVWFDQGIEAGTEWPEFIENRLCDCGSFLVFMSDNAVDSVNCRNEINLALSLRKETLVVYLKETTLRHGMRLQLSSVQSMFAYRSSDFRSFIGELCQAKALSSCKDAPQNKSSVTGQTSLFTANGLLTKLSADGSCYYVIGIGRCTDSHVVIPSVHNGKPVKGISDYALSDCDTMVSVVVPSSVTYIGAGAFDCSVNLTSVELPEGISSIPEMCFNGCRSLTTFKVPASVSVISANAFANCSSLRSVFLSKNTFIINEYAFFRCISLQSITLPETVSSIGEMAFGSCSNLSTFIYNSTKMMWSTVITEEDWAAMTKFSFIHCTDGFVYK